MQASTESNEHMLTSLYSTFSSHVQPTNMSQIQYTVVDEDGQTSVTEEGFIGDNTINTFNFRFTEPKDITQSIANSASNTAAPAGGRQGRLGFAQMKCNYPDGTSTFKVVMTDCILQYRKAMEATKGKGKYGIDYICMGVKSIYVNKFINDATNNSDIKLGVKQTVQILNRYHWFNVNTDRLEDSNVWVVSQETEGPVGTNVSIRNMLVALKKNIMVDITASVSASITSNDMGSTLDLKGGSYNLSIRPSEVFLRASTTIDGPVLEDIATQRKESADKDTTRFMASDEIVGLLRTMHISR